MLLHRRLKVDVTHVGLEGEDNNQYVELAAAYTSKGVKLHLSNNRPLFSNGEYSVEWHEPTRSNKLYIINPTHTFDDNDFIAQDR